MAGQQETVNFIGLTKREPAKLGSAHLTLAVIQKRSLDRAANRPEPAPIRFYEKQYNVAKGAGY